jgi:hypothetical protein
LETIAQDRSCRLDLIPGYAACRWRIKRRYSRSDASVVLASVVCAGAGHHHFASTEVAGAARRRRQTVEGRCVPSIRKMTTHASTNIARRAPKLARKRRGRGPRSPRQPPQLEAMRRFAVFVGDGVAVGTGK